MLLVGHGRGLAGRAGDDEAVGAVGSEVGHQRDKGVLVDALPRVEGCDDRREDGAEVQVGHGGSISRRVGWSVGDP